MIRGMRTGPSHWLATRYAGLLTRQDSVCVCLLQPHLSPGEVCWCSQRARSLARLGLGAGWPSGRRAVAGQSQARPPARSLYLHLLRSSRQTRFPSSLLTTHAPLLPLLLRHHHPNSPRLPIVFEHYHHPTYVSID